MKKDRVTKAALIESANEQARIDRDNHITEGLYKFAQKIKDGETTLSEAFMAGAHWADDHPVGTREEEWKEGEILAHKRVRGAMLDFRKYTDQSCEHFEADFMVMPADFYGHNSPYLSSDWRSATETEQKEFLQAREGFDREIMKRGFNGLFV